MSFSVTKRLEDKIKEELYLLTTFVTSAKTVGIGSKTVHLLIW